MEQMDKKILLTAAVLGLTAIIFGAFGAHALKKVLTEAQLQSFEIGVRYQMYHALFLLFIGTFTFLGEKERSIIFYLTIIGVLFFSGSIYFLATNTITNLKKLKILVKVIIQVMPIKIGIKGNNYYLL